MSLFQTKLVRFGDLPIGTGFMHKSLFFTKAFGKTYNALSFKGIRVMFDEDVKVSISQ